MFSLEVRHLSHHFDEEPLFKAISFTISSGTLCQLVGDNGVGKSTCLRLLSGLIPLVSGELHWESDDPSVACPQQAMAYMGHALGLQWDLTVHENLCWHAAMHAHPGITPASFALLSDLKLEACLHAPVRWLSAGQKKRLAWVMLFATGRPMWLLDEPFTHLDCASAARLVALIQAHLAGGGAVLYTSHATPLKPVSSIQMAFAHD